MRRFNSWFLAGSMALLLAGCAAKTPPAHDAAPQPARVVGVAAPSSSPLAKVSLGMTKQQVRDLIGPATAANSYSTGKVFIPFYFGNDAGRTSWYYKGMGRVVFADGNIFGRGTPAVIRVDYDPGESGAAGD